VVLDERLLEVFHDGLELVGPVVAPGALYNAQLAEFEGVLLRTLDVKRSLTADGSMFVRSGGMQTLRASRSIVVTAFLRPCGAGVSELNALTVSNQAHTEGGSR
jgi:hypothetical protein